MDAPAEAVQIKKEDIGGVEPIKLSEAEEAEQSYDLNKLYQISQVRESSHPQFDGMGYMKYNETNEMADISFIAPKKNKFDTRVTSGITHEKDSSILALVQNFMFEANLTVYYKDKELPELSTSLSAWLRKARELCNYDEKRPIMYRNLIVQGTAFAEVKHVQQWIPNKVITDKNADYTSLGGINWKEMGLKKQFDGTDINLVDGKKVFLEDFYQQDIRKQPGIYTVEYIPREIVETVWGRNPRWNHVPKTCGPYGTVGGMITQGSIYSDWFFMPLDYEKLEVVQVARPFENRYQIYINRVPMLECNFPLTAISPSGLPQIAKGDIDPMNMCAYSKGIPAKTKMDQALYDALVRIGVIMFEQQAFPPIGNNTGKLLSPDLFMPTKQTRNVRKEDISVLTENQGLQAGTFNFINMIKENIDNKSVTSLLENGQQPNDMTLGQYLDMQKRQLIKLGGIFDGVINWEKQMAHLMLMDCLMNSSNPDSTVSMKDSFENGKKGLRVLRFKKDNYATSDDLHDEENKFKEATGQDIRYTDLNSDQLKAMVNNPDYYFHYEIVPVDKNNDKVTQAFFIQTISQAANLFGMDSLNVQNLKQRYAQVMGEQFDDIFLSQDQIQQQQQQAALAAQQQNGGNPNAPVTKTAPVASDVTMPNNKAPQKMFT